MSREPRRRMGMQLVERGVMIRNQGELFYIWAKISLRSILWMAYLICYFSFAVLPSFLTIVHSNNISKISSNNNPCIP